MYVSGQRNLGINATLAVLGLELFSQAHSTAVLSPSILLMVPSCVGQWWAELLLQRVDRDVSLREQLLRSALAGGRGWGVWLRSLLAVTYSVVVF